MRLPPGTRRLAPGPTCSQVLIKSLLVAHIAVLGYWLGSELVINSTFRYVSRTSALPFSQRKLLLDHVMIVDQHVRYALVLQLGLVLAAALGYVPGGRNIALLAGVATLVLLAFVEIVHHARKASYGARLETNPVRRRDRLRTRDPASTYRVLPSLRRNRRTRVQPGNREPFDCGILASHIGAVRIVGGDCRHDDPQYLETQVDRRMLVCFARH